MWCVPATPDARTDPATAHPPPETPASGWPRPGTTATTNPAGRFAAVRHRLWRLLPGAVRRWLPETAVGYAVINLFTFCVDLAVMSLVFRVAALPYPVATSSGYLTAAVLGFLLNRRENFASHAAVGPQAARYTMVVASNYAALVVGLSWLLLHVGVQFQVARVLASLVEAVYMYCMLRWWVFRSGPGAARRLAWDHRPHVRCGRHDGKEARMSEAARSGDSVDRDEDEKYNHATREGLELDETDYVGTTRGQVEMDETGYKDTTRGVVQTEHPYDGPRDGD